MDSRVCTKKGLSQKEVFFVYSEPPKILKPTEGPFVLTMAIHGWLSVKQLPAMQETHEMQVQSLAREDPLQEEMPTHSSILTGPVRHSYGQRSLEAYIPQGCKELDTIELHYINYINTEIHTHTHTHTQANLEVRKATHNISESPDYHLLAIPFSRGSSPRRDQTLGSPALQADSLPSEPQESLSFSS